MQTNFTNSMLMLNCSSYLVQNGMSQYPSYYIKPVYRKEQQEEMYQTGEAEKLVHIPTRAALSSDTCSAFHDPEVR